MSIYKIQFMDEYIAELACCGLYSPNVRLGSAVVVQDNNPNQTAKIISQFGGYTDDATEYDIQQLHH